LAKRVRIEARPYTQSASISQDQFDALGRGSGLDGNLQKRRSLRLDGALGWHLPDQTALPQCSPPAIETRLTEPMTPTERPDAEFRLLPEPNKIEPMTLFP
jgi:hypothetical protein